MPQDHVPPAASAYVSPPVPVGARLPPQSTQTEVIGVTAADSPSLVCPACGYPLEVAALLCPECGRRPTPEDRVFAQRRAFFLELTGFSTKSIAAVYILASVCVALLTLPTASSVMPYLGFGRFSFAAAFGAAILFVCFLLGPTFFASRGIAAGKDMPPLYRQLAKRAWLLSIPWVHLPWLAAAALVLAYFLASEIWWFHIPPLKSSLGFGDRGLGGVFTPLVIFAVSWASYWLWRSRWRALCAAAGLPREFGCSNAAGLGARWALYPGVTVAILVFVGIGGVQVLDLLWPGWYLR